VSQTIRTFVPPKHNTPQPIKTSPCGSLQVLLSQAMLEPASAVGTLAPLLLFCIHEHNQKDKDTREIHMGVKCEHIHGWIMGYGFFELLGVFLDA